MPSKHEGITCDSCRKSEFRLRRYKCLVCHDYDLCGACFDNRRTSEQHSSSHPMQCLILKNDHDLFYRGEPATTYNAQSFTCPLCGQLGFTESSLTRHIFQLHPEQEASSTDLICPLCATAPDGHHNRKTRHMAKHLMSVHKMSVSTGGGDTPQICDSTSAYNSTEECEQAESRNLLNNLTSHHLLPVLISSPSRTRHVSRGCRTSTRGSGTPRFHTLHNFVDDESHFYDSMEFLSHTAVMTNNAVGSVLAHDAAGVRMPLRTTSQISLLTGHNAHNQVHGTSVLSVTTRTPQSELTEAAEQPPTGPEFLEQDSEPESSCEAALVSSASDLLMSSVPLTSGPAGNALLLSEPQTGLFHSPVPVCAYDCEQLKPDLQRMQTNSFTEEPKTTHKRDEFDQHWATFLWELIWSSLNFPQTNKTPTSS